MTAQSARRLELLVASSVLGALQVNPPRRGWHELAADLWSQPSMRQIREHPRDFIEQSRLKEFVEL